jgi:hypothetical protein
MNATQIRDLAIKLLGIYCIARVIMLVPSLLVLFASRYRDAFGDRIEFVLAPGVSFFLYCATGYLLLFHSALVLRLLWPPAEEQSGATSVSLPLATWVSLIGLFYLIGALAETVSLGAKLLCEWDRWRSFDLRTFDQVRLFTEVITLILAMLCITKAKQIAEYLTKKTAEVKPTSTSEP